MSRITIIVPPGRRPGGVIARSCSWARSHESRGTALAVTTVTVVTFRPGPGRVPLACGHPRLNGGSGGSAVGARFVYDFAEGNRDLTDLLGGKGANLAEMTRLGLPVPPGFTITTTACRAYLATGDLPAGLTDEIDRHLAALESTMR